MKILRSDIFFLTVFLTSVIQSELTPDTENVCLESETYEGTITENLKKPVKEYKKKKCGNIFKGFSCKKEVINWQAVDEPQVIQKSRPVLKCCNGYKEIQENATRCVPVCSTGCVHGECTAPDKCTCMPGFHGLACDMRSVVESPTQDIFQATEKTELEKPTVMSEILNITKTDFMTETTGGVTVSTTEATVTMTDPSSYESSTTELDEKEISKEKFQNLEFTVAMDVDLNLPTLLQESTEEAVMTAKYSNLKEAVGLENGVSYFSEKFNTEGNEIPSNTKPILEFEQSTLEPTKIYGNNVQVFDFISLLYVLPVSCLVLAFALWIIVKRRKKITESKTQYQLYSKEPFECGVENLYLEHIRNRSESSIGVQELELNSDQPILLGFSQRSHSESPMSTLEAGPKNSKPSQKDLQDCDRSHAIPSEGTFI